jgi:threonyl-tRNA synthetase
MLNIKLNDGYVKQTPADTTAAELASSLNTIDTVVLCKIDGVVSDLATRLICDCSVEFLAIDHTDALDVLRHSTAHLMAAAVKILFPDTKLAAGPATADGFFYDFYKNEPFIPEDLITIDAKMRELIKANIPFEKIVMNRRDALNLYMKLGENFKIEILESLEDELVSVYKLGDVYDLCKGPHLQTTQTIGQAFKLTNVSGSYWKGDKNNTQLQRLYGTAWPNDAAMQTYFTRIDEAEKRDHRKIGIELDLFHLQDIAPGTVFWHTKGWTLYRTLKNFIRTKVEQDGYKEVNTPMLVDRILWEKSGHWEKFAENMFVTKSAEDKTMALKPMNCPCHVQIFNQKIVSYKDLPWRIAEFGSCHRFEPSGALHGLMRVRGFVQDDAHIFCTIEQIVSETKKFCDLLQDIYKVLGFDSFFVKFSDRPQNRAGNDDIWDLAENSLKEAAIYAGLNYTLNKGEGAFYGPKLEFVLKDCLGRDWQCGTLQVDFVMPSRLDAYYVTEHGTKEHPVMLHRAVLGSLERFIGILIEQYAGKFPTWLAPIQTVIATITDEANDAALTLLSTLKEHGIRAEVDIRNEKISYKIREHLVQKIPYILVLGKNEVNDKTVTVRYKNDQRSMSVDDAVTLIKNDSCIF